MIYKYTLYVISGYMFSCPSISASEFIAPGVKISALGDAEFESPQPR